MAMTIGMIVLFSIIFFFVGLMWWNIFKKAGYHGAVGLLMLVPIANIIMLAILAFGEWPIYRRLSQPGTDDIKNAKALSLPLIIIIVIALLPIIALIAAIAIPNLLRAR